MSFFEAVKTALSKYAVFSGRARRKEYWYFCLFNGLVGSIVGVLGALMQKPKAMTLLSMVYALAFLLPEIAVTVRRLHDTGHSGWWYLLRVAGLTLSQTANQLLSPENLLIPSLMVLGALAIMLPVFVWVCTDSQPGTNRFGPNPKGVLDNDTTQRIFQAAAAHEPPYVYLDPAMTKLDPAVTAAMQRAFGASSLDAALAAQPLPELQTVDTGILLVLLKYTTTLDPTTVSVQVRELQNAILTELAERGI